jgi:hypothetical protein
MQFATFQSRRRQRNEASDAASQSSSTRYKERQQQQQQQQPRVQQMVQSKPVIFEDTNNASGTDDTISVYSAATTVKAGSPAMQKNAMQKKAMRKKATALARIKAAKQSRDDQDCYSVASASRKPFWRFRRDSNVDDDCKSVVSLPARLKMRFPDFRRIGTVTSKAAMRTEEDAEYPQNDYRQKSKTTERPRKHVPLPLARFIMSQQGMQPHSPTSVTDSESSPHSAGIEVSLLCEV